MATSLGMKFLEFDGRAVRWKKSVFSNVKAQAQLCAAFCEDGATCVSGSVGGDLYVWRKCLAIRQIAAHSGSVHCITTASDGRLYTSGAEDNTLKLWQ
jgi:WD40 repeat protein